LSGFFDFAQLITNGECQSVTDNDITIQKISISELQ
jgi:hypothetical protein